MLTVICKKNFKILKQMLKNECIMNECLMNILELEYKVVGIMDRNHS